MSYRLRIFSSLVAAALGLVVGGLIIATIAPEEADILTKASLFASIFLIISGLAAFCLYWSKVTLGNREIVYANFPVALRQGILLGILVTGLLLLQSIRGLSWWDAILIIAGVGFVELAFRSRT